MHEFLVCVCYHLACITITYNYITSSIIVFYMCTFIDSCWSTNMDNVYILFHILSCSSRPKYLYAFSHFSTFAFNFYWFLLLTKVGKKGFISIQYTCILAQIKWVIKFLVRPNVRLMTILSWYKCVFSFDKHYFMHSIFWKIKKWFAFS